MRIGLIVDGQGELQSLPGIMGRLNTEHEILRPLYADIQSLGSTVAIVKTIKAPIAILKSQRVGKIIVILDRENRNDCPGQIASSISECLATHYGHLNVNLCVVVKDRCFENWLIADPTAFEKMPARFKLSATNKRLISPNKADKTAALNIIKGSMINGSYSKTNDAAKIMRCADPYLIAKNSRSFRKLLYEVGDVAYSDQSRKPLP